MMQMAKYPWTEKGIKQTGTAQRLRAVNLFRVIFIHVPAYR